MKTLGTRIKRLRESKSMTQDELAQKMGYKSRSSINKIELDLSDLPQSKISLFAEALDTTPAYLMGWDEFAMVDLKKATDYLSGGVWSIENITESFTDKEIVDLANKKFREAPAAKKFFTQMIEEPGGEYSTKEKILEKFKLYENPVSAGRGTWLDEGTEYNYIEIEHPPVSADFALRVRGDSMSPKYNDGDVVFVKSRTLLEPGQVGVFLINGEGYLKQWQGNMLLSLNREYDPIYVEENDEFLIVGKVIEKLSGGNLNER